MYRMISVVVILLLLNCGSPQKKVSIINTSEFTAEIKMVAPTTVSAVEHTGLYHEIGKVMNDLFNCTMKNQIKPIGVPLSIFYDRPANIKTESLRYDVCIPVNPETKSDKLITIKIIPGSEVASTIHTGAYDKIGLTYEKFAKWISDKGYIISGPAREIYLNNPTLIVPESLKTEIQFPVIRK